MIHGAGVAAPGTGTRVQGAALGGLGAKLGDFAGKLFTGKKADKALRDKAVDLIGWRLGQGKNLPETSPAWRPLNRDIGAAWNIAGEVGKKQPFPLTFTSLPRPKIHHNRMGFAAEELNQKIERSIKDRAREGSMYKQSSKMVDDIAKAKGLRSQLPELRQMERMSESAIPGQNTQDFIDENMIVKSAYARNGKFKKSRVNSRSRWWVSNTCK